MSKKNKNKGQPQAAFASEPLSLKPNEPGEPIPTGQKFELNEAASVEPEPRKEAAQLEQPEPMDSFHYIVKGSPGRKVSKGHKFFYKDGDKQLEAETLNEGFFNNVGEFRAICRNVNSRNW